jgi:uncharacterized protein with PQ loop repeat
MDQFLGWTATILFTICYVPQVIKTIRCRSVDGVSVWLFIIQMVANFVALGYAVLIGQPALVVKYALAIVMLAAVLTAISFAIGRTT